MENYLVHYGVKGMKWGVRKARAIAAAYHQRGIAESKKNLNANVAAYKKNEQRLSSVGRKVAKGDISAQRNYLRMHESFANRYAKDLSASDIAYGQKYVDKLFSKKGYSKAVQKINRYQSKAERSL